MSNHPITLPSEDMVQQWRDTWADKKFCCEMDDYIAVRAAQWGADQELEACIANINTMYGKGKADWLRSMRRPKPPSLKEQALAALEDDDIDVFANGGTARYLIRRALEALDD